MAFSLAGAFLCTALSVSGTAQPQRTDYYCLELEDSSTASGSDIAAGSGDEDFFDEDVPSSISSIPTSPDTLRTYTLNGVCIKGSVKKQPSRTLYNIIIRNGRKVVKR